MKKIIISSLTAMSLLIGSVSAQVDRSHYPNPAPAPTISIKDAETFTLANGLKVYVVENHKLPKISMSLTLDRTPILEGDKSGMSGLFGSMMMAGTSKLTKSQLDESIDQIGGSINFSSTSASLSGLKKHQTTLLNLFTDILYNPIFPDSELEKLKNQSISGLAMSKDDPASILDAVSNTIMYGKDHPYGENPSEKSYKNLNTEDFKQYYQTYFRPNIASLAIVGDITLAEAKTLVENYFSKWTKQDVPSKIWHDPIQPNGRQIALVDRATSQQSMIKIFYPLDLTQNNPDVMATAILGRIFGGGSSGRLFMNLREDKGYTYGAYGRISPGRYWGSLSADASVGTNVTDSAVYEFIHELDKMRNGQITQNELDNAKAAISGSFGRSMEAAATIAQFAINIDYYQLPKDYYKTYLKRLESITLDDINNLAKKYFNSEQVYIAVVGKTDAFKESLAKLGQVQMFSNTGDLVVEEAFDAASISSTSIIENYIKAIGGKQKIEAINSYQEVREAEIQGMTIAMELTVDKNLQSAVQKVKMSGQELSKVLVSNGKVTVTAQGQNQVLEGKDAATSLKILQIIPELFYLGADYTLSVEGISQIDDQRAYKVKVDGKEGYQIFEYYSVDSGLKLKSENSESGEMTYADYKEFQGVLFPETVTSISPMIPMPLKAVLKELLINPTLSAETFK